MQIIAGKHRGRVLASPEDERVRPTSSRAREAVFDLLTHRRRGDGVPLLQGARVADICCGSGAMGLEALSRGAEHATFVDKDLRALDLARSNAHLLRELERCRFLHMDAARLPQAPAAYDVIFLDPPYQGGIAGQVLGVLLERGWANGNSFIVLERDAKAAWEPPLGFTLLTARRYGSAAIDIYRISDTAQ